MDPPGLNLRPSRAMEAEIRRRFGLPVCHDPSNFSSEFFLVLSFGQCQFRLTESSTANILQSVIGGVASKFRVCALGDRVFWFLVSSPAVGFHIYNLKSFECSQFKLFFNLWHGGGPLYKLVFRRWEVEEAARWTTVPSSSSKKAPPLTGANKVPVRMGRHGWPSFSNSNRANGNHLLRHCTQFRAPSLGRHRMGSLAQRVFPVNSTIPSILEKFHSISVSKPPPSIPAQAHDDFLSGRAFAPRSACPSVLGSGPSISTPLQSLTARAQPQRFASFRNYFHQTTGILPHPLSLLLGLAPGVSTR